VGLSSLCATRIDRPVGAAVPADNLTHNRENVERDGLCVPGAHKPAHNRRAAIYGGFSPPGRRPRGGAELPDLAPTRTSSLRALARVLLGDQPVKVDAEGEARHGHQRERAGLDARDLGGRRDRRQQRHHDCAAAHYETRQRRPLEQEQPDEGHPGQSPVGCRTV
jgi:hypothetical protein